MSENTASTARRASRNQTEAAAPDAPADETQANGTEPALVTIEIAGLEVALPLKFQLGHVLTDNQARVLDAAYQRQFTNNQNALAKSRAEALAKATTDAERTAKAPLTVAQLADLYINYEPNVGGTPRQSAMEKIRADAAWRMWTAMVSQHNKSIMSAVDAEGKFIGAPVIVKAGSSIVPMPKAFTTEDGTKVTMQDQKDNLISRILTMPEYSDRVQVQIDAIMAERGSKKPEVPAGTTVSLSSDLL